MSEPGVTAHYREVLRYDALCMDVMRKIADGGTTDDVLEILGDSMNACDHVDDESIALFNAARKVARGSA